jgi:enoyl-CoA hydratase/carnithine racemase
MKPVLQLDRRGAVVLLTLDRPERRNALNGQLREALHSAFHQIAADEAVRALVITGTDPAFCAGLDLGEVAEAIPDLEPDDMMDALEALRIPIVAAVNGPAVTGGLELMLACDVVIASDRAKFADTHVRVGVHPGWGMTAALPRLIGAARARDLSLTGRFVDADTAERWGLVSRVVAHSQLLPEALNIAEAIAASERSVVEAIRDLYRGAVGAGEDRERERTSFRQWRDARRDV